MPDRRLPTSERPAPTSPAGLVRTAVQTEAALYLALLVLTWGLTFPLRGLWQDDTLLLRLAQVSEGHGFSGWFNGFAFPMRRLYSLPFHLALHTPQPIWTLHAVFGAAWLGQALAAGWIARLLLPGHRLTRFLAICLTLTATSDYLTDNLTALGYNIAALALLLAVGSALCYLECRKARWVVLSCAALAWSIWTLDLAIPSLPFVPFLMLWRGRSTAWRPLLVVVLAWGLSLAPAVPIEWHFLHDAGGYAAGAMRQVSLEERIKGTASQWLENFRPWRWVFVRQVWYPRPAAVIPAWFMALGATISAAWFGLRARRLRDCPATDAASETPRTFLLAGLFASMALATNAAYAFLTMSDLHYRTHILARTWASLAIAVGVGWAVRRWPRFRRGILVVPAAFVGLGVWGGLERQDLWVSTWRMHHKEIASILASAPALVPGTEVILRSAPMPGYLATEAEYLTHSWLVLLYDQPEIHFQRWAAKRGTGCRATADALECWHEDQAACVASGTCAADRFPYRTLVLMDFDYGEGTYHVVPTLNGDPLLAGTGIDATGYRPEDRILRRPPTARQRALLLE